MNIKTGKNAFVCLLVSCIIFMQTESIVSQAASVREADVTTASQGNELIGVIGNYENVAESKILKRINAIRKEACEKKYMNPATGERLSPDDYVAIKWSSELEWIAQLRAAEATVNESHTRPNGKNCFSITYQDEQSWAENLAWNNTGLMEGIEQWYGEKNDWAEQNINAVTGHYESLINPSYQYIGLGSFRRSTGGWYGVSAEFSFKGGLDERKSSLSGKRTQIVEVPSKYIGAAKIKAPVSLKVGKTKKISVVRKITYRGIMNGKNVTEGTPLETITWSSSKKSILSIDSNGTLYAKKTGKAVVTAKISGGKKLKAIVRVKQ